MSSVRVVVDTSEECSSSVLANVLADQVATTRMFVHEGRDIMNETGDEDKGTGLGLLLD